MKSIRDVMPNPLNISGNHQQLLWRLSERASTDDGKAIVGAISLLIEAVGSLETTLTTAIERTAEKK